VYVFESGTKFKFDGSFSNDCQQEIVPETLSIFMQMLLDGPRIVKDAKTIESIKPSAAALTLSQLSMFNSVQNKRSQAPNSVPRHIRDRETPLAIYIAIKTYRLTRMEAIVDTLHRLGICISYHRLRTISTDIANSLISHFEDSGCVVPPKALFGVFSIMGFDNIDHNPRSTTSHTSFHGSCVSLMQFPTTDNSINSRIKVLLKEDVMGKSGVSFLPTPYTTMEEIPNPKSDDLHVPILDINGNLWKSLEINGNFTALEKKLHGRNGWDNLM